MSDENEIEMIKFHKFIEICKSYWNTRGSPIEFRNLVTREFPPKDIEFFIYIFIQNVGSNPKEFYKSTDEYMLSIISDDPSIMLANLDLNNPSIVTGARKIIQMIKSDSFDSLPVYSEKSAESALNALIIILTNDNKAELKKDIFILSQNPYFSVLVSSGRVFNHEKYKRAQLLFKENNPYEVPIRRLPLTQAHLAYALFPIYLNEPFYENDKYRNMFFLFAVFQLVILDNSNIKIFLTDATAASIFNYLLNFYLARPSYILAFFIVNFSENHFNTNNIIKVKDLSLIFEEGCDDVYDPSFYPSYSHQSFYFNQNNITNQPLQFSSNNNENILHFFYDPPKSKNKKEIVLSSNIVHRELPNGILPTFDVALDFLSSRPEFISIDTIVKDALRYPAFTSELANIFMQKLKNKNYDLAVNLANQILKKIEDIRITWISQRVFFPIMRTLYECLNEITDEKQFEVLFYLFISLFEDCTIQGDQEVLNAIRKFTSTFDEQFRLYLDNFLFQSDSIICSEVNVNDGKPINRLISILKKCKETNLIDLNEIITYPYLFVSVYLWGIKTTHPNSQQLLSLKFPKYKILKRLFVHLSACYQHKKDPSLTDSSNFVFTVSSFECSFELLTKFPPTDESGIRLIILQHLQQIATPETGIKHIQGIILSWRAWIKIFTIEKFVLILIETLIWSGGDKFDQMKTRNSFLYAERILASVLNNSIKTNLCMSVDDQTEFNMQTNKFEFKTINNNKDSDEYNEYNKKIDNAFRKAAWTAIEYVNNYQGSYLDGIGIASFCLLLVISIKNDWKSEFKKVLDFNNKMLKESSWKSLKYSFTTNVLFVSMTIIEINNLIKIDEFDVDFLKMNWRFGLNFFFIQAIIKQLQDLKLIP